MGVRKNAKFLSPTEREQFVQACVLMKADIVNPAAPVDEQYSKWDECTAIHQMIQYASAPGAAFVNFGHGGNGAYSFLSWHRYFLYQFEQQLQTYVAGVMLPYWDWTDPASIMTDTFLGPDAGGGVVSLGYFAFDMPGVGGNTTPLPAWWPASLVGWRLPDAFGLTWAGGLQRDLDPVGQLPTVTDIQETLAKTTYSSFQYPPVPYAAHAMRGCSNHRQHVPQPGTSLTFPGTCLIPCRRAPTTTTGQPVLWW